MVQLHGDEGPSYCDEAARRTGLKVMKAAASRRRRRPRRRAPTAPTSTSRRPRARHLRAAPGERFDWGLLGERRSQMPLVLAGGLTPDNVAEAIAVARPFAVDVASGVEAEPGPQGPRRKMTRFFEAGARRASVDGADERRGRGALRPLRRPLRPRDADAGARRADRGLGRGARRRGLPGASSTSCCATTSAARRRSTWPSGSRSGSAGAST